MQGHGWDTELVTADGGVGRLFGDLPPGGEGHFRLHIYAVVARLLAHLRSLGAAGAGEGYFAEFPFLAGYGAALGAWQPGGLSPAAAVAWWDARIAGWETATGDRLPLRALVEEAGLDAGEVRALIAAGLVEEDIRFGALFAALQAPLAGRRPCIGVLGWLLGEPEGPPQDAWPAARALLDRGLLLVDNRGDPRSEWQLRVPPPVWDALRGHAVGTLAPGVTCQSAGSFPPLADLILPAGLHQQLGRVPDLLAGEQVTALTVRGMTGSGRRTVLGAVARALGRDLLLCETPPADDDGWRQLAALATLTGALPVVRCDPGPGETLDLPALPGYAGPAGVTLGRSGGLRGPLLARALSLTLPPPDRPARRRFWEATGVPGAPAVLDEIAGRFLLTGGHIARAATLAQAHATLDGRPALETGDVQRAVRALNRQALETLATPLEPADGWSDLVLGEATAAELRTLEARCRGRESLREEAGPAFGASLNRGVRALFSGPSGTGKTLAARALAAALQMDLYRVDLAAVVNKYIGETERNLSQVLSRAEELDVVLLLDEGDALMTRRTEVRNANDRYANLETNYLLQRLETYEGIAIVTTNAGQRIDSAFLRRLDVIVDFAPPEAAERWLLWQLHLPRAHAVSPALLEEVAGRCALTGGQIRNAALHATLLALGDAATVGDAHLEAAVQREYRKAGAAYPLRPKPAAQGQLDRLRQLAAELR